MKVKAVILAGGEGSRLGILTQKRTKPAVPFAGKYRIIDFTLSNCVNSNIFDVMIIGQYRPQSLIEHIGSGAPWDLNRDFTGGVSIYTPYKARSNADWFTGTADAVQQNFNFVKSGNPDLVLILSGDHIYEMNYDALIEFHLDHDADLTMATIRVPRDEASRFGILDVDDNYQVTSFLEKPKDPPATLANMGVYVFNMCTLDKVLWKDTQKESSAHDFGKNIIPELIREGKRVFAYPYSGYWMDVGTIDSYWSSQMDLLSNPPSLDLSDRSWVIHTRTEERPPMRMLSGAVVKDSMVCDGCVIHPGALVERSVLSPGVVVKAGSVVRESILLTDVEVGENSKIEKSVIDKRVKTGKNTVIGDSWSDDLVMIGKNSILTDGLTVLPGARIGTDMLPTDFSGKEVSGEEFSQSRRIPCEDGS